MQILNVKAKAQERLAGQESAVRRVATIHAGVIAAAALLVSAIQFIVQQKINTVVGLSGMGMLSMLETVQSVLQTVMNILQPFWVMGFLCVALRIARGQQVSAGNLLEGFRRFGPVLRLMILKVLIFGGLAVACIYVTSMIYTITPFSQKMVDIMFPLMESGATMEEMSQALYQLPVEEMMDIAVPVMVIFSVIYGVIAAVMFYRMRLADLVIMDKPGTRARAALAISGRLSRKKRWQLFRVDLSFWWYYALQVLALLVCWADMLLPLVGINLPVDESVLYFGCYAAGLALQVLLFRKWGGYINATWAVTCDTLTEELVQQMPKQETT